MLMKPVYMLCVNLCAHPRSHPNTKHPPVSDAIRCVSFAFMHIFKHSCVSVLVAGCVCLRLLELLCSSCVAVRSSRCLFIIIPLC